MALFSSDVLAKAQTPSPTNQKKPSGPTKVVSTDKNDLWKGGFFQDVGDLLSLPQYAATGLLTGKGAMQGIRETATPSEALRASGKIDDSFKGKLFGFAADVLLDPLNILPGIGLIGKGVSKAGKASQAAKIIKTGEEITRVARKIDPLEQVFKGAGKLFGKFGDEATKGLRESAAGRSLTEAELKTSARLAENPMSREVLEDVAQGTGKNVFERIDKVVEIKGITAQRAVLSDILDLFKSSDYNQAKALTRLLPMEAQWRAESIIDDFIKQADSIGKISPELIPPSQSVSLKGRNLLPAPGETAGVSRTIRTSKITGITRFGKTTKKMEEKLLRQGTLVSPSKVGAETAFTMPARESALQIKALKQEATKNLRSVISTITRQTQEAVRPLTGTPAVREGLEQVKAVTKAGQSTFKLAMDRLADTNLFGSWIAKGASVLPEGYRSKKALMQYTRSEAVNRAIQLGEKINVYAKDYARAVFKKSGPLGKSEAKLAKDAAGRIWEIATGSKSIVQAEEPLRQAATLMRTNLDDLSKELAKEIGQSIPEASKQIETIINNLGTYAPEYFLKYVNDKKGLMNFLLGKRSEKIVWDRLITRKDIPEAVRREMGAIRDAGFIAAQGSVDISNVLEEAKFFRWVSEHFAVGADTATKIPGSYVRLPVEKRLGLLSGKFVPAAIASDIKGATGIGIGPLGMLYKKLLNSWKVGKVILNPAAQGRNAISNFALMDLGGLPIYSPKGIKYFTKGLTEYRTQGKYYREAQKSGLLATTYYATEIKDFLNAFASNPKGNMLSRIVKGVVEKSGQTYRAIEETDKMAMYIWRREAGDNIQKAAAYANKWLFDYSDIPEAVRFLRDVPFGFPFITFSYKAIPRFAETALKRPTAVSKYYKLFRNIEGDARKDEEEALPEYIKNGAYVRLPFNVDIKMKDGSVKKQSAYLNLAYLLPWGDLGELQTTFGLPSNPAYVIPTAIGTNMDTFTKQPIWDENTDTEADKMRKIVNYIYRVLAPSFAPGTQAVQDPFGVNDAYLRGGYSWDKLYSALLQKPDYQGRLRDLPTTMLDVGLGLKIQPVDLEAGINSQSKSFQFQMSDLRSKLRQTAQDQSLTENEKEKKIQGIQRQIEDLALEFQKKADNFPVFTPK